MTDHPDPVRDTSDRRYYIALRTSQVLYKAPMWCRIETPHWSFYIWPKRIVKHEWILLLEKRTSHLYGKRELLIQHENEKTSLW